MIFRKVSTNDFEQIKLLYKKRLNFNMSKEFYDYLYYINNEYCSFIIEEEGRVIAHNAIIPRKYIINNKEAIIGLSSGGMVDLNYSGIFFNLLKHGIKNFVGDGIIAFPNKNSEPFFTKLLRFKSIKENYFGMKSSDLNMNFVKSEFLEAKMHPETFDYRINEHPKNEYFKLENKGTFVIYKKFGKEVDLVYASKFNSSLTQILKSLFVKGFEEINFIYGNTELPNLLGFKPKENNVFTYKWINADFNNVKFNCQMIDSDVF
jgi:hypothetical protein